MEQTRLSEHMAIDMLDLADIGGTNAQNNGGYLTMEQFRRAYAYVEIGTWNSSDDLDECRLQQATDSSGTSVKDFTTDASGGDYDTDNPVDADGDFVVIEVDAAQLDKSTDPTFDFIRLYVAEGGNSGVDNVNACLARYSRVRRKKEVQGAASTGSQVYVTT